MKSSIELKNMHFFAHHGVLPHETEYGNDFFVTLRFSADLSVACESDQVGDTVNYATVYELVKKEMLIPSKLIEHVAYRILRKVKDTFPQIAGIEVEVVKKTPPVGGVLDHAAVTVAE